MENGFTRKDTLAVKGCAILMMYVHHQFLSPKRWGDCAVDFWPLTQAMTVNIALFFKICVSIFVILTAYGLTVTWRERRCEENFSNFTLQRLWKLECNFLFVFLLAHFYALVMGLGHFTRVYGTSWKAGFRFLLDGLGLAHLLKTPMGNGTWWYMSLAILIIVVFPLLYRLCEKYGVWAFALAVLVPSALNFPKSDFVRWLPCVLIGILLAKLRFFETLEKYKNRKIAPGGVLLWLILFGLAFFLNKLAGWKMLPFYEAVMGTLFVIAVWALRNLGMAYCVLGFLGKHSMNMFLTHTFVSSWWYHDFIYGFGNAWIGVAVLVAVTLPLSIFIEKLKELTGFTKLVNRKFRPGGLLSFEK